MSESLISSFLVSDVDAMLTVPLNSSCLIESSSMQPGKCLLASYASLSVSEPFYSISIHI